MKNILKSNKNIRTIELIGCTSVFFKEWLEYQFDSKMSWDNYGSYWHIDHVTPCNSFNIELHEEQKICFHWTNCQPLEKNKKYSKK